MEANFFSKFNELTQRLILSSIGLVSLLALIYFAHHPFIQLICVAATAAVTGLALWEYYQMTKVKGFFPLVKIGVASSLLYVIAVFLSTQFTLLATLPFIVLGISLLIGFLYFFFNDSSPLVNLATTFFGIFYLAPPLGCALSILYFFPQEMESGQWWLIYALTVTKMTDVGAFFVGKKFGTHLLAAHLSPKKTIEGAIGGLVCSIASSILLLYLANLLSSGNPLNITLWQSIYLGFLISILAQIGDLGESLLKRDAGVKGSNQLPGLGGMLDIVDSLIFTLPFVYFFIKMKS